MFIVWKRAALGFALAAVIAFAALAAGVGVADGAAVYLDRVERKVPIYRVDTDVNKVALTFDAAWGADSTEKLLATLDDANVRDVLSRGVLDGEISRTRDEDGCAGH